MLRRITDLFCPSCVRFGTGPTCRDCFHTPIERWSLRNADRCSPDEIIAAAIIESLAKDFEDWTVTGALGADEFRVEPQRVCATQQEAEKKSKLRHGRTYYSWHSHKNYLIIKNQKKDITFTHGWRRLAEDGDDVAPWHYICDTEVNGVQFDTACAEKVAREYRRLAARVQAAKEVAAKAKRNMERNEAAWNLAESLLGMKRNEFGALVPIKTVE